MEGRNGAVLRRSAWSGVLWFVLASLPAPANRTPGHFLSEDHQHNQRKGHHARPQPQRLLPPQAVPEQAPGADAGHHPADEAKVSPQAEPAEVDEAQLSPPFCPPDSGFSCLASHSVLVLKKRSGSEHRGTNRFSS